MPMQIAGTVVNVRQTNIPDGPTNFSGMGRQGEQIVSETHGKFYTAAYRGALFNASTAAAGTTIPISTTVAATFGIFNPLGSGVNLELVSYDSSVQNATHVVSSILLGIGTALNINPTSVTKLTMLAGVLGGSAAAQGVVFSVATVVATTVFYEMGGYGATSGAIVPIHHEFDGKIILPPGTVVHVCGTAAQTSASFQTLVWAEWPA